MFGISIEVVFETDYIGLLIIASIFAIKYCTGLLQAIIISNCLHYAKYKILFDLSMLIIRLGPVFLAPFCWPRFLLYPRVM